jgi:putative aminopeptidase FrvX
MAKSDLVDLGIIEELSNAYGVSGFEDLVLEVARKYASGLVEISEDSIRNLYLRRPGDTGKRPVVMLDAHTDEVGFMDQAVKPNGTLRFIPLGGWVNNTIPAHRVLVRTSKGNYIPGVVATKPPHFMTETEKSQSLDIADMSIDVGASSREEAIERLNIRIGEPIVPDVKFEYLESQDLMIGKAFDCRLGCASVLATLRALKDEALAVDVVGALSSQEEMGMRGATVTAKAVKPDLAIVFEGCPADDTCAEDYMIQTAIKRGPMLRYIDRAMITNPRFQRFALDLGGKCGIPVQAAVRSGGATNGAPIHLANESVPVIVIGLPVRYIHTHYGIASFEDCKNAVRLAVEIVKKLDAETIQGF